MSTPPPAGWYDDPTMVNTRRYWDGTAWTEHRQERPAAPTAVEAPGRGEPHSMDDRIRESRLPRLILAVIAALVLVPIGFAVYQFVSDRLSESGSASTDATYTSKDMADEIEGGLAEQGEDGAKLTCDAVNENPAAGDKNVCRGKLSSGDPVNILVTYNSDGTYIWEVK